MDLRCEQLVAPELEKDERLLWAAKPDPMRMARQAVPIVLFTIPWTAFAVFWVSMAYYGVNHGSRHAIGPMYFFPLFGVPFVLIGLVMLVSPLVGYNAAKGTYYAVTTKRLLIISVGRTKSIQSFDRSEIGDINRVEYGRKGDITWQPKGATISGQVFGKSFTVRGSGPSDSNRSIGFFGIDNPAEVQRMMKS